MDVDKFLIDNNLTEEFFSKHICACLIQIFLSSVYFAKVKGIDLDKVIENDITILKKLLSVYQDNLQNPENQ